MRRLIGSAVAVLLLTAGCGGSSDDGGGGRGGGAAAASSAEGAPVLHALVGTEDSPDAFEISLTDEDGQPVTELKAGTYNIEVDDPTSVHNFHLTGEGIDEKTVPAEKMETTWVVDLKPGEYRYMCDPHPSMNGHFTVQ